ncbi:hypothetical protein L810_4269 [Burkholderia sp. AU4i]|nr:hypothetical protein L810_4269 [Burkholderia sp. AU4i]
MHGEDRGSGLHASHLVSGDVGHVRSPLNMHTQYLFKNSMPLRQIVAARQG